MTYILSFNFTIMNNLKTLLFAFLTLTFSFCLTSCGDDDEEVESKYIVKVSDIGSTSKMSVDLTFFEYNTKGEKVASQIWEKVGENASREFLANPSAAQVKVYITLSSDYVSSSSEWVQQVYTLNVGGTTTISINGSTKIGNSEPRLNDYDEEQITAELLSGYYWDECDADGNLINSQEAYQLIFNSTGTGTWYTYDKGETISVETFSWKLSGERLTITSKKGSDTWKISYSNGILHMGDIYYKKRMK